MSGLYMMATISDRNQAGVSWIFTGSMVFR